jgi:hypothetical protein
MSAVFQPSASPSSGSSMYNSFINVFVAIGLTTPIRRFLAVSVLVGGVLYVLKPSGFFYEGQGRPWSLFAPEDAQTPPTTFPWYIFALLAGVFSALL